MSSKPTESRTATVRELMREDEERERQLAATRPQRGPAPVSPRPTEYRSATGRELAAEDRARAALVVAEASAQPPPAPAWIRASEVVELPIDWLWPGWIPRGDLTLVESAPKVGKSTVLRDIAARVTKGLAMPGCSGACEPRHVVWVSSEEHAGKAIVPALRTAGADLELVTLRHDDADTWTVAAVEELGALIVESGAALVVLDGIKDTMLIGSEEREMDVRAALRMLQRLAQRTGAAIVGVRHWRKGIGRAADKGAGSIAYTAIAVSVIAIFDRGDGDLVLGRARGRFGRDPDPIAFNLEDRDGRPVIVWGDAIPGLDLDAIAQDTGESRGREDGTATAGAVDALRQALAHGPMLCRELQTNLEAAGHKWRTVQRAAKMLRVVHDRGGYQGDVRWSLPVAPTPGAVEK